MKNKFLLTFTGLGLIIGLFVALPLAWTLRAPKPAPAVPSINVNLTAEQLSKRLGKPTAVTQPSGQTNNYAVIQYESHEKAADGSPRWVVSVGLK